MSTNKTQHYHLNQWEAEDKVLRAEFNQDNAKLDSAMAQAAQERRSFAPPSPKLSPGPIRGMEPPARPSPWALLPRRS